MIAREGWIHISLTAGLALLATVFAGWVWSWPLWLISIFVIQFFRDPKRSIPQRAGVVVCPADGRVVFVGPAQDPYMQRKALKISVFMNVFNVHSNRSPVRGCIVDRWYSQGKFINAELDKASEENERNALKIKEESGLEVVCVQVAGLIA
ncbi:MAG: phosphatidylserine decarboxylase, partial [Saprospiraceae bacterium]|nr:phosphatidylserine decarboxylase [Saprospiraceae bacterium]